MTLVTEDDTKQDQAVRCSFNLGGLLSGLGGFIEKLGELAKAGEHFSQTGESPNPCGKICGVFGINVTTALGEGGQTELKFEPFGNVRKAPFESPLGEDVREPLYAVREEDDQMLISIELPGVASDQIKLKVLDDRLWLLAERGKTTYRKEIDLFEDCSEDRMSWECKNGLLLVRFHR